MDGRPFVTSDASGLLFIATKEAAKRARGRDRTLGAISAVVLGGGVAEASTSKIRG